jgi:hypothetical protein
MNFGLKSRTMNFGPDICFTYTRAFLFRPGISIFFFRPGIWYSGLKSRTMNFGLKSRTMNFGLKSRTRFFDVVTLLHKQQLHKQ